MARRSDVARHSQATADRAFAAYLGLAIGDALGATVEFMTPREIATQYGIHDRIRGGGWLGLKSGQVTDDTTMALALGQSILKAGQVDALAVAQAFDDWMRARPIDIGNTVRRGILRFRQSGVPGVPPSEHDAGNGAAMRVLPVALAMLGQPEAEVRAASRIQAHVTHHNPLSDAATECVVLMVQAALSGASRDELLARYVRRLVAEFPQFEFERKARSNPSGFVVETMQAVFQGLFSTADFASCLIDVVNRGGDADTTGAIAGMIAGALYGPAALPARWVSALETGTRERIAVQTAALLAVPSPVR